MLQIKNFFKKFIIALMVIIMIFCFIIPSYSHAASIKSVLTNGFQTFMFWLSDGVLSIAEDVFTGHNHAYDDSTYLMGGSEADAVEGNTYDIKYGVGVIVSGTLPFFDIDFMNPMEDQTITNETEDTYDAKAFLAIYRKIKDEISREIDYTGEHYSEWQDSCSDPNVNEDPVLPSILTENQMEALNATEVCTLQNKINQIRTRQRYVDTGNPFNGNDDAGTQRSFESLISEQFYTEVNEIWEEKYGEKFYDDQNPSNSSDWHNVFYSESTDDAAIYEKYTTENSLKTEELKSLFQKMEPVIQKIYEDSCETKTIQSTAKILAPTVGKYYAILRTISLIALLSVMVYIGIKIIISSTAGEKAKYKEKLVNVFVALCILFVMQYIIAIFLYVLDLFNQALKSFVITSDGNDALMTAIRTKADIAKSTKAILTYTVLYVALVIMTAIFTIMYVKRMIMMILLTVISPAVAVTYPIDKENDGKAQAFEFWFKEFVFNILIQPVHLILYVIFVSSAMTLVDNGNFFWALAVLMFMTQAERIIRKMFGINGETLPDSKSSIAGMAIAASAVKKMAGKLKSVALKGGKTGSSASGSDETKIRQKSIEDYNEERTNNKAEKNQEEKEEKETNRLRLKDEENTMKENKKEQDKQENKEQAEKQEKENDEINKKVGSKIKEKTIKGLKGAKRVAKIYGGKVFTAKNAGKLAQLAGKVALGATGGAIGLSAAIATGDPKKIDNYVARGVMAGSGIAGFTGQVAKKVTKTAKDIGTTYRIGYNGWTDKEYQENVVIPKLKKQNARNMEVRDKYERELGNTDYLDSKERDALYEAGIIDENKIIDALKQYERDGISKNEMVQNALIASRIKDRKDFEAREKQLRRILEKQGLKEKELEKTLNTRMKRISELSGIN